MMMSLFSVFDPVTLFWQMNWLSLIVPFVLFLGWGYFIFEGGVWMVLRSILFFGLDAYGALGSPNSRGLVVVVLGVLFCLIFNNIMGLFPFVFTGTAHPVFTVGLGLVLWGVCFLMGWFKGFVMSSAHLVPEGSPLVLSFFLVLVESISHLIRPFTLSIRLAANMMAGHLLIGLLSKISMGGLMSVVVSLILQSFLMVLESGVAIIQGVVFSILLMLYTVEYY